MSNHLAQWLHFGVYLVTIAAWTLLEATGHASGGVDAFLPALIGTAAGSVLGYHAAEKVKP